MKLSGVKEAAVLLGKGLEALIFPGVCLCCGDRYTGGGRRLCEGCLAGAFEPGNPLLKANILDHILPDGVEWVHALWKFDKGGRLQELIHKLKYQHQQPLGVDFGRALGASLLQHPGFEAAGRGRYLLVPVPLHKRKQRRRGYNQAEAIAAGVEQVAGIRCVEPGTVLRTRYTTSQTGLEGSRRLENIRDAFQVHRRRQGVFEGSKAIVIDDVITTGATALEVGRLLMANGARSVAVLTVARP